MEEAMAIAARMHREHLLIESAGLFWLGAEAGILVLVRAGRRHLETTPLPAGLRVDARVWREAAVALAAMALLCALVYGRHALWIPAADAMAAGGLSAVEGAALAAARERAHLGVWAAFVAGWVALEVEIVRQGWMGYHRFRRLFAGGAS